MEFPITEKFKNFKEYIESSSIQDILTLNFYFIKGDEEITMEQYVNHRIKMLNLSGYKEITERYNDILNINRFHFHAWLEIDGYGSQVEFNISKVSSNLTILDFDANLWFEGQSPEEIALWKTFRIFDTRPEIGDGKMAVFSIQEGVSPPNEPAIYYLDRDFYCKTSLTFVQYYETMLDMMGIADWQLLFSDVSLKNPMSDHYYHGLKESLEALAKAFPDKDYNRYFELLEARWV